MQEVRCVDVFRLARGAPAVGMGVAFRAEFLAQGEQLAAEHGELVDQMTGGSLAGEVGALALGQMADPQELGQSAPECFERLVGQGCPDTFPELIELLLVAVHLSGAERGQQAVDEFVIHWHMLDLVRE